jgi:DNA modification methylase
MNKLFFGDNLDWLMKMPDESVDLVYLDPPFNSKAAYNILYETPDNERGTAQAKVFRDTWEWLDEADDCFNRVLAHGGKIAAIINALTEALGKKDTMAYLVMMAARLIEIRRVMKPTASLYLHCDPAASHYLKIILDAIIGPRSFRNEIIWQRTQAHGRAKRWGPIHDVILFYSASDDYVWNRVFQKFVQSYLDSHYRYTDKHGTYRLVTLDGPGPRKGSSGSPWRAVDPTTKGRHWELPPDRALPEWFIHPKGYSDMSVQERLDVLDEAGLIYWPPRGTLPQYKRYLSVSGGNPIQDIITDIDAINSQAQERIGYPTQKPIALLKRIIQASSNKGDVILDPFCGCGTTVHAAAELERNWIGIDVSYYGVRLIQRRIVDNFGPKYPIEISGIPADLKSAQVLAETDHYGFQQWVVGELGCQLWNDGKKGADGGIDGEMWFYAGPTKPGRLLVQVKGGKKIGVQAVREFMTVLDSQKAQMGVFFSRAETTSEMRQAASGFGSFNIGSSKFPRLQLITLADWLGNHRPKLPAAIVTHSTQDRSKQNVRPKKVDRKQPEFLLPISSIIEPREGLVFNPSAIPQNSFKVKSA